jgi:hypothetical protein
VMALRDMTEHGLDSMELEAGARQHQSNPKPFAAVYALDALPTCQPIEPGTLDFTYEVPRARAWRARCCVDAKPEALRRRRWPNVYWRGA